MSTTKVHPESSSGRKSKKSTSEIPAFSGTTRQSLQEPSESEGQNSKRTITSTSNTANLTVPSTMASELSVSQKSLRASKMSSSVSFIPFRSHPQFRDVTVDLAKKPGLLKLHVNLEQIPDVEHEKEYYLSQSYFNAPIRDHKDNDELRRHSLEPDTDAEIIFKNGRVAKLVVPPEIIEKANSYFKYADIGQCCREEQHQVSSELQDNIGVQGPFLARVLIIEMLIHVPILLWLFAQYYLPVMHSFIYHQRVMGSILIVVIYITLFWGTVCTELGRVTPCDALIIVCKIFGHSHLAAMITSQIERWVVRYRVIFEELNDPESYSAILNARTNPETWYSYPLIMHIITVNIMIYQIVLAIFFKFFKGNIKKDGMLWLAVVVQLLLIILQFVLINLYPDVTLISGRGPPDWDVAQIVLAGLCSGTWELWRLYCLREVLNGRKFVLNEKEYRLVAISFP